MSTRLPSIPLETIAEVAKPISKTERQAFNPHFFNANLLPPRSALLRSSDSQDGQHETRPTLPSPRHSLRKEKKRRFLPDVRLATFLQHSRVSELQLPSPVANGGSSRASLSHFSLCGRGPFVPFVVSLGYLCRKTFLLLAALGRI